VVRRAASAQIKSYAQAKALGEDILEAKLYPDNANTQSGVVRAESDCAWIHRERARPGVTLALLHLCARVLLEQAGRITACAQRSQP
jgi:hypothetical protein